MSHDLQDLQNLADGFIKLINDMKLWIFDKEECLLGLVKQLTRILSDWDNETEEMITKLHTARDKQVSSNTRNQFNSIRNQFNSIQINSSTPLIARKHMYCTPTPPPFVGDHG